ncbi:MAG: trigger factor [Puniceicoccales bacterium]|nr:trigger factor [Puniceicoccales bacterium]
MKSEIKDVSNVRKVFTVTVSKDEAQNEESLLVKTISRDVKMPGFRKGHVPEAIVRVKFAKDVKAKLDEQLYSRAMETMTKEHGTRIFSVVKADFNDKESGEKELIVTIDTKPDFELIDYRHIDLAPINAEITDGEVDSALEQLRNYNADYVTVDRNAKKGDFVRLSYQGTLADGSEIAKLDASLPIWGEQKNTWEEAGAEDSPGVKAVIDGIVGMKAEEDREIETTFPEDFYIKPLAGKSAKYMVHVFEVREKVLPGFDDKLLAKLNANTLDELRVQIREDLKKRKHQVGRLEQREQLVRKLIASVDFDVPESAVEHERAQVLRTFFEQQIREGVHPNELEKHKDELYGDSSTLAHDRAKISFILERIAIEEKITVSSDEVSRMIIQEASVLRTTPDKLIDEIKNDRARVQDIQRRALFSKTLDFLVNENTNDHPSLDEDRSKKSQSELPENVAELKPKRGKKSAATKGNRPSKTKEFEEESTSFKEKTELQ